ncbi:MAG: DUF2325 domain-containing protein [Desulfobulbaceae bacterium]|nr:DUF2325 domain-containing protein [Desulfobulbaceae bacterium]
MSYPIAKSMTNRMLALPPPALMAQGRKKNSSYSRKRLWDIDAHFLCSLMGLCLSRGEQRRLARERVYGLDARASDYQLHAAFVSLGKQCDSRGKALNKYLEKKYRPALRRYAEVTDEATLRKLWRQDCDQCREAQAWWHLLTHPSSGTALLEELYGELHMLGHEALGLIRNERSKNAALQNRLTMLEEVLASERVAQQQERERFDVVLSELHGQLASQSGLEWENQELAKENERLRGQKAAMLDGTLIHQSQERVAALQEENNRLRDGHEVLEEELGMYRHLAHKSSEREKGYSAELEALRAQYAELAAELLAAEQRLRLQAAQEAACTSCEQCGTDACPGVNLCGKTVLYVGGHHKMVPHYRRVVEEAGGSFLHHDGGVESARSLLPSMLSSADAVMCPIDCVSHDACVCVKKMCKRLSKPCVLMRSSGLSSLARGLDELVQ